MDTDHIQDAFNLANIRAIKCSLTEAQYMSVFERMTNLYQNSLPLPKAIQPSAVSIQIVKADMALKEIDKFKSLCGYGGLPSELHSLLENMLGTQIYDVELEENANKLQIFPALEEACRNTVPGSTVKLAAAKRALDVSAETSSPESNREDSGETGRSEKDASEDLQPEKEKEVSEDRGSENVPGPDPPSNPDTGQERLSEVVDQSQRSQNLNQSDILERNDQHLGSGEPDPEEVVTTARRILPQGWMLLKNNVQYIYKHCEHLKNTRKGRYSVNDVSGCRHFIRGEH